MRHPTLALSLRWLALVALVGCELDSCDTSLHHAAALRWPGAVDLDVGFDEFYAGDHTVALWFMPQYPYGPAGPLVGENGTGTYVVGLGDYRWGNGGFLTQGDAVLYAVIGNASQTFVVPGLDLPQRWAHLAIVRSGSAITLHLNGQALSPSLPVTGPAPTGTLRLGRRTEGMTHGLGNSPYVGQFYGFIDDVAVFDRALPASELAALRNGGPTGHEAGLIAAYRFEAAGPLTPGPLQRTASPFGTAFTALVSELRDDAFDADLLPRPDHVVDLTLPFGQGQAWAVNQGMHDGGGSHNGTAAFSIDLVHAGDPDSTGEPLYAIADGTVVLVRDWNDCDAEAVNNGSNAVVLKLAPNDFAVYHHLEKGSASAALGIGPDDFLPQALPDAMQPVLSAREKIGHTGSTGLDRCDAAHAHISVRDDVVSHPFAFTDYEASDDGGQTWYPVAYGIPQPGQWVRVP